MKTRRYLAAVQLLLLVAACEKIRLVPTPAPAPALAPSRIGGHEGGNGGDTIVGQNTGAWFLTETGPESPFAPEALVTERPITVCIRKSAEFGVSDEAARFLIADAAEAWGQYLRIQEVGLLSDGKRYRPASRVEFSDCSGPADLEILMGVSNEAVARDRREFANPIAYVWPTLPPNETGWRRGYMWIAPPGSLGVGFPRWGTGREVGQDTLAEQAALRQILMHEWGHLVGCDHVAGTVMRAEIRAHVQADPTGEQYAKRWQDNNLRRNLKLGRVDEELKLMLSRVCYGKEPDGECLNDVEHKVLSPETERWPDAEALALLYGDLRPRSIYVTLELRTRPDGTQRFVTTLRAFAEKSTVPSELKLDIHLPDAPLSAHDVPRVFKMIRGDDRTELRAAGDEIVTGNTELHDRPYTVLIQRTPGADALSRLWLLVKGRRLRLN